MIKVVSPCYKYSCKNYVIRPVGYKCVCRTQFCWMQCVFLNEPVCACVINKHGGKTKHEINLLQIFSVSVILTAFSILSRQRNTKTYKWHNVSTCKHHDILCILRFEQFEFNSC